jgi:hypothetical protein
MKTCVVRRRFYSTEANNATVDVDLEPGFGIPKAIAVIYVENNSATDTFNTALGFRNFGIGFCGGGVTTCCNMAIQDTADPTSSQKSHFNTRLISATNTARSTTYYRAETVTFLDSKVRINFVSSSPQTNGHLDTLIWAVTGDDVTAAVGISSFNGTAAGTRDYSQLAFQPDFLMIASPNTLQAQTLSSHAEMTFGMATRSPLQQASIGFSYVNGVDPTEVSTAVGDNSIANFLRGATFANCDISAFSANGWTMRTNVAVTANTVYTFLAVKSQSPSDFALIDFNTPVATGNTFAGTGSSGFVPETAFCVATHVSTLNAVAGTRATGAEGFSIGAGFASSYSKLYNGNGTITYTTANSTVTGTGSSFFKYYPGVGLYTPDGVQIGTVSSVTDATSLTLTANALISGTSQAYTYSGYQQHSLAYGDIDNDNAGSQVYSLASSRFYVTTTSPSTITNQAYLRNFDSRPGLSLDFTTSDATTRYGFIAAFKGQDANRRRGSII